MLHKNLFVLFLMYIACLIVLVCIVSQKSSEAILDIMNIVTATFAYLFWTDWRRSSVWAATGFLFPFVFIFAINSMPFSKLAGVDIDDATHKTSVYIMRQLGYHSKGDLWNLGTGFMTDALRKSLMDLGVEKMFSALECASGTHPLVTGIPATSML